MDNTMRYYIYVSDRKLDMLYPQIPKKLLANIASELNINLKLLAAEFSANIRSNQNEETRYSKLRLVVRYIEKHLKVGAIDAPLAYFKGILPLSWRPFDIVNAETKEVINTVLFKGFVRNTHVILTGSAQHIIGSEAEKSSKSPGPSLSFTLTNFLLSTLYQSEEVSPSPQVIHDYIGEQESLRILNRRMIESGGLMKGWPEQRLEVLGRTLIYGPQLESSENKPAVYGSEHPYILLGTPLYVALAD